MNRDARIFVAGHRGLVGSACVRRLQHQGFTQVVTRTRTETDLSRRDQVDSFFREAKPEYVILAAARVGGIKANSDFPVDFLLQNLEIQNNVIRAAHESGVARLLFLGSSCIYPKFASQPISEDSLLTGALEPTNEPYAIAKITGIKLCQAYHRQYGSHFISAMPTNMYGPFDNFDLATSHVLPALIHRFHVAKVEKRPEVVLWGTGSARREFLYSDDLADACILLLEKYESSDIINIGCGSDLTIAELAKTIARLVGYEGHIGWDSSKPDGTPRKLLNVEKIHALGWKESVPLDEGILRSYRSWLDSTK